MKLNVVEELAEKIYNREKEKQLQVSNSILMNKLRNIHNLKEIINSGVNMLGYSDRNYATLRNIILSEKGCSNSRIFSITTTTLSYQINDNDVSDPTHDVISHIFVYNNPSGNQIDIEEQNEDVFIYQFSNFDSFKLEIVNLLDIFNKKKNEVANIHTIINDSLHIYIQKKMDLSWEVDNIFNFINYCELKSRDEEDPSEYIKLAA